MFKNKLVAVMNKSVESGKIMNALGHIALSLGGKLGKDELQVIDYKDADGNVYPDISKMPFIILKANSNKIKSLYEISKEKKYCFTVFTNTMTIGSWDQQIENTKKTEFDALEFWGILMCGPWQEISDYTRKFSLWT